MHWLTEKQVSDLTGYKQHNKQREALNTMGIDHRVRPDGSLVVFLNDMGNSTTTKTKRFEING